MAMYAMSRRQAISRKVLRSLLMAAVWLVLGMASAHAGNTVTKVTYVYTNAQGTPLAKADAQGNIIARYTYRPYGAQQSGPTNNKGPGYTGHVNDPDTGLVYMQQRYYDPDGRFISPDPVAPTPGNIYSFNRYAYANNNPIRYTDPDGRCVEDFCLVEVGVPLIYAGIAYVGAKAFTNGMKNSKSENFKNGLRVINSGLKATSLSTIISVVVQKSTGSEKDQPSDKQRPSKTPNEGKPGTKHKNPGSGQERWYGKDGKPIKDVDYDHDHGQGKPHVHDWERDPDGRPVRKPGRPYDPSKDKY